MNLYLDVFLMIISVFHGRNYHLQSVINSSPASSEIDDTKYRSDHNLAEKSV